MKVPNLEEMIHQEELRLSREESRRFIYDNVDRELVHHDNMGSEYTKVRDEIKEHIFKYGNPPWIRSSIG